MSSPDFIQTFTGIKFHFLDPRPEEIAITDIAHALANQCRFNGHTKWFYSVAQHSVLVAEQVAKRTKDRLIIRQALLHDAAEAYIGDLVQPLKHCGKLDAFREIEEKILCRIFANYGVPVTLDSVVSACDYELLGFEARRFWGDNNVADWGIKLPSQYAGMPINECLDSIQAKHVFLEAWLKWS